MAPKQQNPRRRKAVAPYNFVPLPEQAIYFKPSEPTDPKNIERHDRYAGLTGHIDCQLQTLTPLYTRTALNPDFFSQWGEKIREMMADDQARADYAEFFHLGDPEIPVIPGSTLRGMTRTLVEIISYGKMQWVTDERLFFRTMDNTAIGDLYRGRMMEKVEGGLLRKMGNVYTITKCRMARVPRPLFGGAGNLYDGSGPNQTPRWQGTPAQYTKVWVRLSENQHTVASLSYQPKDNFLSGILVITGNMQGKQKEFVLLTPTTGAEEITVPDEMIERFHADDQITQWQEKAFPADKPHPHSRPRNGWLRKSELLASEGDPVFFLREKGALTFFGRARMFRLPYQHSPRDLVPPALRASVDAQQQEMIDLAEAIFGYVAEDGKRTGRAGRVYFSDATLEPGQTNVLFDQPITPDILGSPKPTTFQHYLVQDGRHRHDPDIKDTLAHYDTPISETVIRGHKLYWHKHEMDQPVDRINWKDDKQHTQIRPVRADVTFTFRVYFENLAPEELGAILWALTLPSVDERKQYRHKVGMGKPRGLGSVAITPTLVLSRRRDRTTPEGKVLKGRYRQLFAGDNWYTPQQTVKEVDRYLAVFENSVLDAMDQQERGQAQSLAQVKRIALLLKLLEWAPGVGVDKSRYMRIRPDNEFRQRPVLPDPEGVADH